jgi:fructose-bisphosphate aldolase class II
MSDGEALPAAAAPEVPAVVCAGMIIADLFVSPLASLPRPGELVVSDGFLLDAGGCAVNTAVILTRLGVRAGLVGKVGDDDYGRWLQRSLARRQVLVDGVSATPRAATSQTVILPVDGEDRRYIHVPGANAELAAADIAAALPGARVLAIGGYLALSGLDPEESAGLLAAARARGTATLLDVVVPRGADDPVKALRPVLPHVDCFLPNTDEARLVTGHDHPADQARALLDWGCRSVIITGGAGGATYADPARVIQVRPFPVEMVDGSGAGDAFTAGIILGLIEGWPAEQRLRFAAALGGSVCRGLGCTAAVFTRDEALAAADRVHLATAPWPSSLPVTSKGVPMPLVPAPDLLAAARAGGYALGYFESWDSYSLEAVLAAAAAENAPVIVGFGATMLADEWLDAGGIEFLGASGRALIEGCPVPVAFLLNETHTLEQAVRGVEAGFNFVMIDSHRWPVPQARDAVATLVAAAHPAGVAVEAEFGSLPDYIDGAVDDSHAAMTDPAEAAEFVAATGVDCLAVAVGNVHLLTAYQAEIDLGRLQAIRTVVDAPLAIHGGTGFPPDSVAAAISLGVAKFNVGTRLKRGFLDAVLARTRSWTGNESVHDLVGSHKQADFLAAGQSAITETVRSLLRLYGSSSRA